SVDSVATGDVSVAGVATSGADDACGVANVAYVAEMQTFSNDNSPAPPDPPQEQEQEQKQEQDTVAEWVRASEANGQALGITEDAPGDYDRKATLPNALPPLKQIAERVSP